MSRSVDDGRLRSLKAQRLAAGLSLDIVAERTGLPVAHVEALEEGRLDDLPAGPYIEAYYRLVARTVGVNEIEETRPVPVVNSRRLPLWAVRMVAVSAVTALLGLIAYQLVSGRYSTAMQAASEMVVGPTSTGPDQTVELTARREARFKVQVDGEKVFDGRLAPGQKLSFEGRDRIVIELPGAEYARLEYNGSPVVPQGRQGVPRRLVFIDDVAPDG
jgi:hypothetical protein